MSKLLVSEKIPWMAMLCGYLAMPTILAACFFGYQVFDATTNVLRGEPQIGTTCIETIPRTCYEHENYQPILPNILYLLVTIAISGLIWSIGFRYRAVWREHDGSLKITWGERIIPITIKTYASKSLTGCTVTKEQRFTITGGGVNRVGYAPDRWRVKAMYMGRTINVGSFASESEANTVITSL